MCPKCGDTRACEVKSVPGMVQCKNHHKTSVTAGTILHRSKQSLTTWSYAVYLISTLISGISALQFQRQLGIKRYETAFNMFHKLRSALVAPGREKLKRERRDARLSVESHSPR